eukprot:TRINITY_DN663_c0_g2_i1.p1 TRINITY_DN663_c0_g2~~TRINITY_DN663_c0_g2_i1.p1  ORF type:complete len:533 (-),score=93.35 TRINITY_DN663_c0_g2_i1:1674-3272(-)
MQQLAIVNLHNNSNSNGRTECQSRRDYRSSPERGNYSFPYHCRIKKSLKTYKNNLQTKSKKYISSLITFLNSGNKLRKSIKKSQTRIRKDLQVCRQSPAKQKMLEEQGLILMVPIDKNPSTDLKERIKKTINSCKGAIDDQYKKKTFYQFLEALIAHIVTALTGDNKVETMKEYKEKVAKIAELENELQLRANTVQNYVEESKRLKAALEQAESKGKMTEKRAEELTQKYNKIELLYKDSENRRSALQTDHSSLLEEAKMLRKIASEKFELERKCSELTKEAEETGKKLKEAEGKIANVEKELAESNGILAGYEKELTSLRSEVVESKKVKEMEATLEKLKTAQVHLEEELKNKGRRIGELTVELEDMKTRYVNVKTEYEDYQSSQELVLKKNANDLKEVRRQYNKEKDIAEGLSQTKVRLEKECKELKDRIEVLQRNATPAKSVTQKEKAIVEALSTRAEMLMEENEKLKGTIADLKKKVEHYETESKVQLQLLVSYAAKYAQDHLEEYKETYDLNAIKKLGRLKVQTRPI